MTRAAGLPSFDLNSVTGRLRLVQPDPEFPAGFEEWDHEKQRVWWHTFYATKQGRRYYERANAYVVKVETDGLFHVDDVPEGRYRLNFEYETKSVELIPEPKKVTTKVAVLEAYVDVPAGPEEQPLDIGGADVDAACSGRGRPLTRQQPLSPLRETGIGGRLQKGQPDSMRTWLAPSTRRRCQLAD